MVNRDMEYRFLMIISVCLLIMGACELACFRQWEKDNELSQSIMHFPRKQKSFRENSNNPSKYGYNGLLDKLRSTDFSRFSNAVYVDYTGAGQYRDSQLTKTFNKIKNFPFGNTHSNSPASKNSEIEVEKARALILEWFHTTSDTYEVVFTSGTTAGLHLIGETFPWTNNSNFYYLRENHNSVLGIREIAMHYGANFHVVTSTDVESACSAGGSSQEDEIQINNLFAYPLEENFSGKLFPKDWVNKIQGKNKFDCKGRWYVLLDIAAYAPTHEVDLTEYPADFVVLSFYKMFGFPTGIGALLIRKDSGRILNKVYYGGGSVLQTITQSNDHRLPESTVRRFEDGTPNFLGIVGIQYGLEALREVGGLDAINQHTSLVTDYLYKKLKDLKHSNGKPVVQIYGNHDKPHAYEMEQGPIVTLNVLTPEGEYVSFTEVEKAAARYAIHLRAGWHCNPGATYSSLGLSELEVAKQIREHQCFSSPCIHQSALTIIHNVMAGAVRISLGYLTTFEDCDYVVRFIQAEYLKFPVCNKHML